MGLGVAENTEILVTPESLLSSAERMKTAAGKAARAQRRLIDLSQKTSNGMKGAAGDAFRMKMSEVCGEWHEMIVGLHNLTDGLTTIAEEYAKAEGANVGVALGNGD